jgi:hypothetical protein
MMSNQKPIKLGRDAKTGRFIKKNIAKANPSTTIQLPDNINSINPEPGNMTCWHVQQTDPSVRPLIPRLKLDL